MALKTTFYAEYQGKQTDYNDLVKAVKEQWAAEGNLIKDLVKLDVYYKPEESTCYYVANDKKNGSLNI
jgi:allophanate hydrolase subunit 1